MPDDVIRKPDLSRIANKTAINPAYLVISQYFGEPVFYYVKSNKDLDYKESYLVLKGTEINKTTATKLSKNKDAKINGKIVEHTIPLIKVERIENLAYQNKA